MMQRHRQRGVATLTLAVLLLFGMALLAFFANRSLLVEQKSAANHYRASIAFEMAEAGLEWATAMLNDPRPIDAQCRPAAGGLSFRDKYLPLDASFTLAPPANARPACRIAAGVLDCSCPDPGANPSLGNGDDPSFGISLAAVATDTQAVRLIAAGCTGQGAQCIAGSAQPRSDALAGASVMLKLRPLLRALPAATLTAGGAVTVAGTVQLANLDAATQGSLVVAGRAVDASRAAALLTVPGSPSANALYASDAALDALLTQTANGSGVFNAFFGMTPESFKQALPVLRVSGATAADRTAALRVAYAQGYSAFFAEGDLLFDASGIGSAARPVLIVGTDPVRCSAPCQIHGLLYADVAARDATDLTNVGLRGALVTRGEHVQTQGGLFAYDANVLAAVRRNSALLVRVPGSWRDF
jgi:hypothetical protein